MASQVNHGMCRKKQMSENEVVFLKMFFCVLFGETMPFFIFGGSKYKDTLYLVGG